MSIGIGVLGAIAICLVMLSALLARREDSPLTRDFRELLNGKKAGKMFTLSTFFLVGLYVVISRVYKEMLPILMKIYFCYTLTAMTIALLRPYLFRSIYPDYTGKPGQEPPQYFCRALKIYAIDFVSIAMVFPLLIIYWFSNNWVLMNFLAIIVTLFMIDVTRFKTLNIAVITMIAFFIYDIYFVYFTPIMVTVAKKVNIPVKLVWPRTLEDFSLYISYENTSKFVMLGLGDIVLPGIYITLLVRIEKYLMVHKKVDQKPGLVRACIFAYIVSICMASTVLCVFKKAQPVLLYIVPCLLIATYGVLYFRCDKNLRNVILQYVEEDNPGSVSSKQQAADKNEKETTRDEGLCQNQKCEKLQNGADK